MGRICQMFFQGEIMKAYSWNQLFQQIVIPFINMNKQSHINIA